MISTVTVPLPTQLDFPAFVADQLNVRDLDRLHLLGPDYDLFTRETDQSHWSHRAFYDRVVQAPGWDALYGALLWWLRDEVFRFPFVHQRVPTFRVHLPGNVSVGEPHRDADYRHATDEIVCWVPLTIARETSAVWVEDGADFRPVEARPGELVVADYANQLHMNRPNTTGFTRVSFDLRIIPRSLYSEPEDDRSTINTALPFRLPRAPDELTYFTELRD